MSKTKHISFLLKPASSACNMRCKYCFYADVAQRRETCKAQVMSEEIVDSIIDKALSLGSDARISFMFQGGEPTLVGLRFFERFCAKVSKRRQNQVISYALQSNGLLIDKTWIELLKSQNFLVGISVDGYEKLHDYVRPDVAGNPTFKRAIQAYQLLKDAGVPVNILTVLTSQLASHPQQAYKSLKKYDIDHVQYIPCLSGLDEIPNEFSLKPKEFTSFYKQLLGLWKKELKQGVYRRIWLFENYMQIICGMYPSQCGMLGRCAPHFVVEADGSVYPCDFYATDNYCLGNITTAQLNELAVSPCLQNFLSEPRRSCKQCATCSFEKICHKNCKRLNWSYYTHDYCGLRDFLQLGYPELTQVVRKLSRMQI